MNVNLFPALPNFNITEIYPDAIYRNREFFTGIGSRKINDVDCHETKGQFEHSLNTLLNEFKKAVPELNRSGFGRDIRVVKFFGMLMNSTYVNKGESAIGIVLRCPENGLTFEYNASKKPDPQFRTTLYPGSVFVFKNSKHLPVSIYDYMQTRKEVHLLIIPAAIEDIPFCAISQALDIKNVYDYINKTISELYEKRASMLDGFNRTREHRQDVIIGTILRILKNHGHGIYASNHAIKEEGLMTFSKDQFYKNALSFNEKLLQLTKTTPRSVNVGQHGALIVELLKENDIKIHRVLKDAIEALRDFESKVCLVQTKLANRVFNTDNAEDRSDSKLLSDAVDLFPVSDSKL